jgi:hypothetical protein
MFHAEFCATVVAFAAMATRAVASAVHAVSGKRGPYRARSCIVCLSFRSGGRS